MPWNSANSTLRGMVSPPNASCRQAQCLVRRKLCRGDFLKSPLCCLAGYCRQICQGGPTALVLEAAPQGLAPALVGCRLQLHHVLPRTAT